MTKKIVKKYFILLQLFDLHLFTLSEISNNLKNMSVPVPLSVKNKNHATGIRNHCSFGVRKRLCWLKDLCFGNSRIF